MRLVDGQQRHAQLCQGGYELLVLVELLRRGVQKVKLPGGLGAKKKNPSTMDGVCFVRGAPALAAPCLRPIRVAVRC